MRAVVQRVSSASVAVDGVVRGSCAKGLAILLGIAVADDAATADRLAGKVVRLRVFEGAGGRLDRSLLDVGGGALVVSQFTLLADTRKGTRPSFIEAARPEEAEPLYERFCAELERDPQLAFRLLGSLSLRLHRMVGDVEAMTLHSATQRVIGYLARVEEEGGEQGVVTLPAQKALVASSLNLTPEYFSRILHELAAGGLLVVEGRRIRILDADGLRAYGARSD